MSCFYFKLISLNLCAQTGIMLRVTLIVLCFLCSFYALAQNRKGNTFAIVIGVSQYEDASIPALQFAERDAMAFADYLQSKAGGFVPSSNISLLIGKKATLAAVDMAMNRIMEIAETDDVVYFYFAGHGDIENNNVARLGYLLTYNTPPSNYRNNAVRLEDLNNFAHTLSVNKKAKVVLITDACHSGKLAGNNIRGNFLVGNQLRTSIANEIRITSCAPDQLSNESEAWGGGRGVFSYYLVNGLIGFADKEKDGYVRLGEIKQYVDSSIAADPVLTANNKKQTPVIPINNVTTNFVLSFADQSQMNSEPTAGRIMPVAAAPVQQGDIMSPDELINRLISNLNQLDISRIKGLELLLSSGADDLPVAFIKLYKKVVESDTITQYGRPKAVDSIELKHLDKTIEALLSSIDYKELFKKELVLLLHTQTQQVINDYLNGSEAELERRRYYNAGSNGYDAYPVMLQLAMKLTDKDHFLYRAMEVNRYYFEGVSLLLKIPLTPDPAPLIEKALQLELKALQLEKEAACIYNILGVIYLYKNDLLKAEYYFLNAKERSPQWAIPYSNLMSLYIQKKLYGKATLMYDTAFQIQPGLQNLFINRGFMVEQQGNLLLAEELQRKSIVLNSRHYYPFERLGYIYNKTTNYALADSFFYEADVRKRGYHLLPFSSKVVAPVFNVVEAPFVACSFDENIIRSDDVLAQFAAGMKYYRLQNWAKADSFWRNVIALDVYNPLVFHWLGKMQWEQKDIRAAEVMLNFATDYFLNQKDLIAYADSLKQFSSYSPEANCYYSIFMGAQYNIREDHYYLADIYERRNNYEAAAAHYRTLISIEPGFIGPYKKLMQLYEKIGRYTDAESIMLEYKIQNKEVAEKELNALYQRILKQLPEDGSWFLKAGNFYYNYVKNSDKNFKFDRKRIFPDETVVEYEIEENMTPPPGVMPEVLLGTGESLFFAGAILTPITDGIRTLQTADSLMGNNLDLSADVNDKIGDLYLWQGLPTFAAVHYQKSVDMLDINTSVRNKLIDVYDLLYQFTNAGINLDTLNARNELTFEKLLLQLKYNIHAGKFNDALGYLLQAQALDPYTSPDVVDLNGRLHLLSGKYKEALTIYKELLEVLPADSCIMYSISRIYALQKNRSKAMVWLNKAVNAGFNYGWVLQFDPAMESIRKNSAYKALMKQKMKEYPPPSNTYKRKS